LHLIVNLLAAAAFKAQGKEDFHLAKERLGMGALAGCHSVTHVL
jgi:hypothetical protein